MRAIMTRREAMIQLGAALAPAGLAAAQETRGCLARNLRAAGRSFRSQRLDLVTAGTGDRALDRALGRALVRLSRMFGETPGFGFYDDGGSPNALATNRTYVEGTWGTVAFGTYLFRDLLGRYDDQGMSVMATVAHEFGHIAQFSSGVMPRLDRAHHTVKYCELHADVLLGYYLGVRKRQNSSISLWAAGHSVFEIGDYEFNDPNHHGTPDERVAAAESGFGMAQDGVRFERAFSQGVEEVLSRF